MDATLPPCNIFHAHAGACVTELTINGQFTPGILHRVEFVTAMGKVYQVDDIEATAEGALVIPIDGRLKNNWNEYAGGLQVQVYEAGETCPADIALTACDEYGDVPGVYKIIFIDILGGSFTQNIIG